MIKIIAGFLLIGLSGLANAATWMDINVASLHSQDSYWDDGVEKRFNGNNFGWGITRELNGSIAITGGLYLNSYREHSLYFCADISNNAASIGALSVDLGVKAGVATGYDTWTDQAISPLIVPHITAKIGRAKVTVGVIPGKSVQALTLQIGIRF